MRFTMDKTPYRNYFIIHEHQKYAKNWNQTQNDHEQKLLFPHELSLRKYQN